MAKLNAAILESNASTNQGIGALNLLIERAALKADHALRTGDDLRPRVVLLETKLAESKGRGDATQQILTHEEKRAKLTAERDLKREGMRHNFWRAVIYLLVGAAGGALAKLLDFLGG